ncbi:nitrite transporter [Vreelandella populi]|uniref:nitrite transporter n=1 Tax=Vreelandella populi TaxID=2498858 RepID=UPI000F8F1426|nr:nitrite transporter [Halomonas populi]RUR51428.1 nitrite transporter [Halomonas populi]
MGGVRHFDCYGLVRAVRAELYGLPTLPAYEGVATDDARRVNRSLGEVAQGLQPSPPQAGAMALCWTGALALHCGVVVPVNGRMNVMECTVDEHVRCQPLRAFCKGFTKVEYYT